MRVFEGELKPGMQVKLPHSGKTLEVKEGYMIKDLIEILSGRYGCKSSHLCFIRPLYSDKEYANICLNDLDLNNIRKFPRGLETTLKEGDTVSFGVMGGAA